MTCCKAKDLDGADSPAIALSTTPATITPIAIAASSTPAARSGALGPGFIDVERSTIQIGAIECLDGGLGRFAAGDDRAGIERGDRFAAKPRFAIGQNRLILDVGVDAETI